MTEQPAARITILYDNTAIRPDVAADWGFACAVETPAVTLLFDTGTDEKVLLRNMATLGFAPSDFHAVMVSHDHYDHTGGLAAIIEAHPGIAVIVPNRFSQGFKEGVRQGGATLREIEGAAELAPGLHSTGQLGDAIVEQALVLDTASGLVVVTGCAHPGVATLVAAAKAALERDVALVLGGFHLYEATAGVVRATIEQLQSLGVARAGPCHCSGPSAIEMFAAAYGGSFVSVGAGWQDTFAL